jgi:hypothetical protein
MYILRDVVVSPLFVFTVTLSFKVLVFMSLVMIELLMMEDQNSALKKQDEIENLQTTVTKLSTKPDQKTTTTSISPSNSFTGSDDEYISRFPLVVS